MRSAPRVKRMRYTPTPTRHVSRYEPGTGHNYVKLNKKRKVKKYKPKQRPITRLKNVEKQIKKLNSKTNSAVSTHTARFARDLQIDETGPGFTPSMITTQIPGLDKNQIEGALANIPFYNEELATWVENGNPSSSAKSVQIKVKFMRLKLLLKNNFQSTCYIRLYLVKPKKPTDIGPHTAFTNGIADAYTNSTGDVNSVLSHITDSQDFNQLYKIVATHKERLGPGESKTICSPSKFKPFLYNPADRDAVTENYDVDDLLWVIQTHGEWSHGSTTTSNLGWGEYGIDIARLDTLVFEYNSGGPSRRSYSIKLDTTKEAFTSDTPTAVHNTTVDHVIAATS